MAALSGAFAGLARRPCSELQHHPFCLLVANEPMIWPNAEAKATGAAKAVGEVLPATKGKLTGMAFRALAKQIHIPSAGAS